MWAKMKDWLTSGAIDQKDTTLETDLTAPGYHINRQDKLVIESKEDMAKRGVASPDDGDALALTFAMAVMPPRKQTARASMPREFAWT
jgi:phage terminase large subunit